MIEETELSNLLLFVEVICGCSVGAFLLVWFSCIVAKWDDRRLAEMMWLEPEVANNDE